MGVCVGVGVGVCVCVYVSLASDSSDTIEVIIIKLCTASASAILMHHVLIILTLTFSEDHTDFNLENNKYVIISESIPAMPIKFAVKIVRLKVYTSIASPMAWTLIQGHKCVSNVATF